MICEKIDLYAYFNVQRNDNNGGFLNTYASISSTEFCPNRQYPAILIFPGGGYSFVSKREAEPVALEYLNHGFNAFVLEYSVISAAYPTQLIEAAMAMIYIRENSKKYSVSVAKIATIGFSAGGHLCASLACLFNDENIISVLGEKRAKLARPDAAILCYPVISSSKEIEHKGSLDIVSGGNSQIREYLSLENRVNTHTPPTFLWHTLEDSSVPPENSLEFAKSLRKHNVSFELHIFCKGHHGLSVCNKKSDELECIDDMRKACGKWIELSINFLKLQGISL